ncbi:MAG: potassium channel family protein [Sneathiellales bacterium]|nr:potassium channel family protein [Sneathiellales bacterium]
MIPLLARKLRSIQRKTQQKLYLSRRTQDYLAREALTALFYFSLIIGLHTYAMMIFEGLSFRDATWLTTTSITTVGYGDLSAKTDAGRLSTTILIFFGGIFVLGKIAGDFFEFRQNRASAKRAGHWSFNRMQHHIVIIGSKIDSETHIQRLAAEFERNAETQGQEIVLITNSFGDTLPQPLQKMGLRYVHGRGSDPAALQQAGVANANIIILLAWDENDKISDGSAFDIISRIREAKSSAKIVAECVDNENRRRLTNAGANLVLRPIRAYPEMIVGGIFNPGSISILENLFTASGESIIMKETRAEGTWTDIVTSCIQKDEGLPIAYRSKETGSTITAPRGSTQIHADALFLLQSN